MTFASQVIPRSNFSTLTFSRKADWFVPQDCWLEWVWKSRLTNLSEDTQQNKTSLLISVLWWKCKLSINHYKQLRPPHLLMIIIKQHLPLSYFFELRVFSIWITNGNNCSQPFENFLIRHLLLFWLSVSSLGLSIADLFRWRWRCWFDWFGILT